MRKLLLIFVLFLFISCEKKEANNEKAVLEKAVDSYGAIIEKAKGTEAILQKKADSLARQSDSLGIP
ncbi:MAG: hypothetical protein LBB36_03130 [Fibromonadaceae bacterium]|nr:hypothetical protein [Fibromonadaceae bacterium]